MSPLTHQRRWRHPGRTKFGFHTIPERYMAWVEVRPQDRRKGLDAHYSRIPSARPRSQCRACFDQHQCRRPGCQNVFVATRTQTQKRCVVFAPAAAVALPEPVWPDGYLCAAMPRFRTSTSSPLRITSAMPICGGMVPTARRLQQLRNAKKRLAISAGPDG